MKGKDKALPEWLKTVSELPVCSRCQVIAGACLDKDNCPKKKEKCDEQPTNAQQ